MDNMIKQSIDARRQAIFNAYKIEDKELNDQIDDFFNRLNDFGTTCSDSTDFEMKLATNPLSQEYIQLFTEISTKCSPIVYETDNREVQSTADYIKDDIASEARMVVEDLTMPARHAARTEFDDKVRDIPIIGDAIQAKQTFDLFKKFKKNKKDDSEESIN